MKLFNYTRFFIVGSLLWVMLLGTAQAHPLGGGGTYPPSYNGGCPSCYNPCSCCCPYQRPNNCYSYGGYQPLVPTPYGSNNPYSYNYSSPYDYNYGDPYSYQQPPTTPPMTGLTIAQTEASIAGTNVPVAETTSYDMYGSFYISSEGVKVYVYY